MAEPLADKRDRKVEYPEKTLYDELQNVTYWSPKIQDPTKTRTHAVALVQARKADVLTITPHIDPYLLHDYRQPGSVVSFEIIVNFLVAVVNMLNSSKEISEFSLENADVESICYCKQRMKSKLSLFFRMCWSEAL